MIRAAPAEGFARAVRINVRPKQRGAVGNGKT